VHPLHINREGRRCEASLPASLTLQRSWIQECTGGASQARTDIWPRQFKTIGHLRFSAKRTLNLAPAPDDDFFFAFVRSRIQDGFRTCSHRRGRLRLPMVDPATHNLHSRANRSRAWRVSSCVCVTCMTILCQYIRAYSPFCSITHLTRMPRTGS